jgi:hypothetical protein
MNTQHLTSTHYGRTHSWHQALLCVWLKPETVVRVVRRCERALAANRLRLP